MQSLYNDLGLLLQNIAHDYKNKLGIIGTIVKDLKEGYKIDMESLDDSLSAYENLCDLSRILEQAGYLINSLKKTDSNEKSRSQSEIDSNKEILRLIEQAMHHQLSSLPLSQNTNEEKRDFRLMISKLPKSENKISGTREQIETAFSMLLPFTQSGATNSSRALISIVHLLIKFHSIKNLEISLFETNKENDESLIAQCVLN